MPREPQFEDEPAKQEKAVPYWLSIGLRNSLADYP